MSDLFINYKHETHHLRLIPQDFKGDVIVWQATFDHEHYMYFEAHELAEIWELMQLAVDAFTEYNADDETVTIEWEVEK